MTPATLTDMAPDPGLEGWARVAFWCWGHADNHGHARAYPNQLRTELHFATARDVSRAIHGARVRRLIDQVSTAACLVRPGCAVAPCEASHRGIP